MVKEFHLWQIWSGNKYSMCIITSSIEDDYAMQFYDAKNKEYYDGYSTSVQDELQKDLLDV